jgi:hypothetical protein
MLACICIESKQQKMCCSIEVEQDVWHGLYRAKSGMTGPYKGLDSFQSQSLHLNGTVSSVRAFLHFAQPIYHHLLSGGTPVMVTVHLQPSFCQIKQKEQHQCICINGEVVS